MLHGKPNTKKCGELGTQEMGNNLGVATLTPVGDWGKRYSDIAVFHSAIPHLEGIPQTLILT